MNFRKASIFQCDTEKPEEQNDSGGMLSLIHISEPTRRS